MGAGVVGEPVFDELTTVTAVALVGAWVGAVGAGLGTWVGAPEGPVGAGVQRQPSQQLVPCPRENSVNASSPCHTPSRSAMVLAWEPQTQRVATRRNTPGMCIVRYSAQAVPHVKPFKVCTPTVDYRRLLTLEQPTDRYASWHS